MPTFKLIAILLAVSLSAADLRPVDTRAGNDPHTKTNFKPRVFTSLQAWTRYREPLRRQVLNAAGLWPMPRRGPVPSQSFGDIARPGYTVEKRLVETLPGFYIGVNVYRPASPKGKLPGVLVAHGHWKHGRVEHDGAYSVPALCAALAVNGYVALAYDMVGYNDTREVPHKFGDSDLERLWFFGPLSLQLWNSIRLLDYLVARPDVDPARLAVTGASGGGTQTYLLAAVDDRIKVSIPADMVSAKFQGDDPCEMAPGLRIGTNNMELAALMAPRPMLLLSSARDWTSDTPTLEFPAIREVYKLFGQAKNVESFHVDAEHGYNIAQRHAALQFLNKHFAKSSNVPEPNDFTEPPTSFLIGTDVATNLPGALDRDGVFLAWQNLLSARNQAMTPPQKRRLLQDLTGSPWPTRVRFVANGEEGLLHREGGTGAVPVKYTAGARKEAVIAVHQDGTAAALKMEPAKDAIARGAQVLLVDLFNTGAAAKPASGRHGDHLVFHYSDDANQVQDLVTAAAWLATKGAKSVRLLCGEGTVEVCRLAAAIAPVPLKVEPASPQRRALKIPGLLAAGYSSH